MDFNSSNSNRISWVDGLAQSTALGASNGSAANSVGAVATICVAFIALIAANSQALEPSANGMTLTTYYALTPLLAVNYAQSMEQNQPSRGNSNSRRPTS